MVGLQNHEGETVQYSVVTAVQRVEVVDNGTNVTVLEEEMGERYSTQVAHNETAMRNVSIQPTMTGERLRVVFLLYKGDPPATPTVDNAYRELHLWVNVSAANESSTSMSVVEESYSASLGLHSQGQVRTRA